MAFTGTEIDRLIVVLAGDSSSYRAMLADAEASTKSTMASIASYGAGLAASVTAPLAAFAGAAVVPAAAFERTMQQSVGLANVAQSEIAGINKTLLDMAPSVGQAPNDLARAYFLIAGAGLKGQKAIEALHESARASSAGMGHTHVIADALTSVMNAYSKTNLGAAEAADVLSAAVREGKMEANQFAPVVGRIIPMASALGVSFAEAAGPMAVMTRTGASAAEASVSLGNFFSTLAKAPPRSDALLQSVGLSFEELRDVIKQPGGVVTAMRMVDAAFKGNQSAIARVFPNFRGLRAVLQTLTQDGTEVSTILDNVRNSTGSADHAFKAVSGTLSFVWDQAVATVKVTMIELGTVLFQYAKPAIEALGAAIAGVRQWWGSLDEQTKRVIITTAGVFAAIGPLIFLIGKLGAVIQGVVLAKLIGEIGGYVAYFMERAELLIPIWEAIKTAAVFAFDAIRAIIILTAKAAKEFAELVVFSIPSAFREVRDAVTDAVGGIAEWASANRDAIIVTAGWIGTFALVAGAVKLAIVTFGFLKASLVVLGITQAISAIAWAAYVITVGAVSVALTILKGIIWLVNFAFATTNALLGVGALATAVIAVAALGAAFLVVGSAAYAAWQASGQFFKLLGDFGSVSGGPLADIGNMIGGWGSAIKEVFAAVKVDSELAFQLMKAHGELAFAQLAALLPPLWALISSGFEIVWNAVAATFENSFKRAIITVLGELLKMSAVLGPASPFAAIGVNALTDKLKEGLTDTKVIAAEAGKKLDELGTSWSSPKETAAIKTAAGKVLAARKKLADASDLQTGLAAYGDDMSLGVEDWSESLEDALERYRDDMSLGVEDVFPDDTEMDKLRKEWNGAGKGAGDEYTKGATKALEPLDAVGFNSAEAIRRRIAYQEKLASDDVMGSSEERANAQLKVLEEQRDLLQEIADKDEFEVSDAGLGEF